MSEEKITFNHNNKFDIQLGQALIAEKRLADIFCNGKIELKTETWQWKRTGNICIEYRQNGKPSGIAVTEAEIWIHELRDDDGSVFVRLMFEIDRLKALAKKAHAEGRYHLGGGDGGRFDNILIPLRWVLR